MTIEKKCIATQYWVKKNCVVYNTSGRIKTFAENVTKQDNMQLTRKLNLNFNLCFKNVTVLYSYVCVLSSLLFSVKPLNLAQNIKSTYCILYGLKSSWAKILSLSYLEFLQLSLLGGSVWPPVTSDVCHLHHLLQPLGQAQEPLAHLPQSAQCGAQLSLCLLQAALVGSPLPLSGVQCSVLNLRYTPGYHSLSAGQHRGEQRLAIWAAFLQELKM